MYYILRRTVGIYRNINKLSFNSSTSFRYDVLALFKKMKYSKTCLKQNLKGPENVSAEARFPFSQGIL
jgi:hypothetical protein